MNLVLFPSDAFRDKILPRIDREGWPRGAMVSKILYRKFNFNYDRKSFQSHASDFTTEGEYRRIYGGTRIIGYVLMNFQKSIK
jgi:hypothetical protein